MDPLPFQEFAFGDMPDAAQGPSALDWPLSVLKQGIASRVGCAELMATCTASGDRAFKRLTGEQRG